MSDQTDTQSRGSDAGLKDLLQPEVIELIKQQKWSELREAVEEWPTPDLADLFNSMDKKHRVLLFRALPRSRSAALFSYLTNEQQNELLYDLTDDETRYLLTNMTPDDRTALLGELPGEVTQQLLSLLSPQDLKEARRLLGYPDESVGRLMTPDYVAVRSHWTVEEALEHIRKIGKKSETINVIYVTDAHWKLIDALEVQQFLLTAPDTKVEQIMDDTFISVSAFEDRENAVQLMQRYDKSVLPVVDSEGVLLGIVTFDDILDVAELETTEDFHKTAAVAPLKTGYHEATIWTMFTKRISWLIILVFVNLVSSGVIEYYEEVLASALALAFFIPLLIDSGGNAGAQSATVMVRAIAIGDVQLREWWRAAGKEIFVGLALGLAMGLASYFLGMFRGNWEIGLVVGFSMVAIVLAANLIGTVLPFLLTRFNIDPAVASSPLITTIVDAAGLLIYFSIALLILGDPEAAG